MQTLGMVSIFLLYSLVLFQNMFNMYQFICLTLPSACEFMRRRYWVQSFRKFSNWFRLTYQEPPQSENVVCIQSHSLRGYQQVHVDVPHLQICSLFSLDSFVISSQALCQVLVCLYLCKSLQLYEVFEVLECLSKFLRVLS